MFAMFLYIVLYMQNVLGYSPLETGVRFLPISILSFLAAPVAGKLSERFPVRWFLGAGLLLVGIGLLLMSGIKPSDDWTTLLAGFLVAGVGIGFINPPLATAAIGVVEPRRAGAASGINSTFRQVGTAVGIAGLGALLQSKVTDNLDTALAGARLPRGAADHLAEAVSSGGGAAAARAVPPGARELVATAARKAYIDGFNEILVVAAVLALVGAVLAVVLVRQRDFVTFPADAAP
jgi:MFS family permease